MTTNDTLLERTTETLPEFVPVIFANGKDDDSYGVAAWLKQDQRVQFDGRIYAPGEHIVISGRSMRFERGVKVEASDGEVVLWVGGSVAPLLISCSPEWRGSAPMLTLTIDHTEIDVAGGTAFFHPDLYGVKR